MKLRMCISRVNITLPLLYSEIPASFGLQREQNLTARKLYSPLAATSQSYSFLIRNLFDKSWIPPCRKWQEYNKFTVIFLSTWATMDDVNGIQCFVMDGINSRMARYVSLLKIRWRTLR